MNKTAIIIAVANECNITTEDSRIAVEEIEKRFFLSKKTHPEIITSISESLSVDKDKAMMIFDNAYGIIKSGMSNKLKHPLSFGKSA